MIKRRHLQVVASNGKNREDTCHHLSGHLPHIEAMRLNDMECLFLAIFRYICEGLSKKTDRAWQAAHHKAAQEFGTVNGPILVAQVADLVHAIHRERRNDFSFMVSDCPVCSSHLCEEEQKVLELLRAARTSDGAALADHARALVDNGIVVCVVLAASALGAHLDARASSVKWGKRRMASRSPQTAIE